MYLFRLLSHGLIRQCTSKILRSENCGRGCSTLHHFAFRMLNLPFHWGKQYTKAQCTPSRKCFREWKEERKIVQEGPVLHTIQYFFWHQWNCTSINLSVIPALKELFWYMLLKHMKTFLPKPGGSGHVLHQCFHYFLSKSKNPETPFLHP